MSGSLGPINGGAGVNPDVILRAGGNPLESAGKFVNTLQGINQLQAFPGQMELQRQAIQSGAATLGQHLNRVGAGAMLPALANPNFTMDDIMRTAGAVENAGLSSHGVLNILGTIPFAPNTPEWRTAIKQGIASLAQVNSGEAVAQIAGTPAEQQTANGINAGVRAPATAGGGFTPATTTPMGIAPARTTRPATADDVARDPSLTVGQSIQTVLPGASGGAPSAPAAGSLGPGGYRPPQRPLNQLGPAYTAPGGAPAAPGTPPPRAAPPGSVVMRGPGGAFMVPPDKIEAFRAAGYR